MGSLDAACIAGFLCRLCSEMHRTVIHIYSDQGQKHGLAGKINAYLPVTITPNDPLPKTICKACMKRVEQHHELMVKLQKNRNFRDPIIELTRLEETSPSLVALHSTENRSQARQPTVSESTDTDAIDENDNNTNSSSNDDMNEFECANNSNDDTNSELVNNRSISNRSNQNSN